MLKLIQFLVWWYPEKARRLLADRDSQELGVRFSLALLFLFVALSEFAHLEPVLGAFLGGTMLSIIFREKTQLEIKLSGFGYGFLVPIFFIHIGMQFDIANVLSLKQLLFTAQLLGFVILIKVLPSLFFVFIGLEFEFIKESLKDVIILIAIITSLLGPSLFKTLYQQDTSNNKKTEIDRRRLTAGWMRQ